MNCFSHVAPSQVWTDGAQFLYKFQRGIRAVKGDGNCLFRALSMKIAINIRIRRRTFCTHNKQHFQAFCHLVPIVEKDRVWGTDLEIHAAASLWQIKVYVCVPDPSSSSHSWIYFNRIPTNNSNTVTKATMPTRCLLFYAW